MYLKKRNNDVFKVECDEKGVGCEPVNLEKIAKQVQILKEQLDDLDPAVYLALAYQFKFQAEKYGYKWFWDRADDKTDEEEALCMQSDENGEPTEAARKMDDILFARQEKNHKNILNYYNNKALDVLAMMGVIYAVPTTVEPEKINLWDELNVKPEW